MQLVLKLQNVIVINVRIGQIVKESGTLHKQPNVEQ